MAVLLINTEHGPAFLGEQTEKPCASWLRAQLVQPDHKAAWFKAYPVIGGAILIQAHRIQVVREATKADLRAAQRQRPYNPAAESVAALPWAK